MMSSAAGAVLTARGSGLASIRGTKEIRMELHRGRLIDHIGLVVRDIEASRRFYEAVGATLGIPLGGSGDDFWIDELFVSNASSPATQGRFTGYHHIAFQAANRAMVDAFHKAGLAAGGKDNGGPGERANYHPGYYAAFLLDPDGNNIEAVCHKPA
jgi:catechol 2,3-dioxygenase-like lactoylglutathione lyase family enzyme